MSKQDDKGAWVIPPQQLQEFLTKPIDYDKLIQDCLETPQSVIHTKKKNKKSFWTKEITFGV